MSTASPKKYGPELGGTLASATAVHNRLAHEAIIETRAHLTSNTQPLERIFPIMLKSVKTFVTAMGVFEVRVTGWLDRPKLGLQDGWIGQS